MAEAARRTVLVLAEHDTTLHDTVALFERDGFTVQMASGEDNVATWLGSFKPALIAYRLTDPSTRRSVCRSTLQAVAALPGSRTPSLALCELNETAAAAALCKEGLADDYLIVPHLTEDVDRLATVTERLIAVRAERERQACVSATLDELWQAFMRFDVGSKQDLQQDPPRNDPDGSAEQRLAALRAAHHRAQSRLSGAPVLVVDDDPDFQSLLATLVGALKRPAVTAGDVAEALDWLDKHTPSLILLDYQMPGADGVDLLARLRQSPRLRAVPVIMLTGQSRLETVQRVRRLGVNDFIVKPADPPTLIRKIAACL
ncbi:MAG: response regulator [Burkholderiaceae bacterium]|nr:response regulator [Burkholderiaceae bacterium]